MRPDISILAFFLVAGSALGSDAVYAQAKRVDIAPHRASYDLSLEGGTSDLAGAEGRIGFSIVRRGCDLYDLDYRFVARFQRDQDLVVTDQRTTSTEDLSAGTFSFEKETLVDGISQDKVAGRAVTTGGKTTVTLTEPGEETVSIPASLFPTQHTIDLIESARKGQRIVENTIYDGDVDAGKRLTSTSVIAPRDVARIDPGSDAQAGKAASAKRSLDGLKSWRVSESFYNSDSDADGMPVFQTAYTLYENGVSDDLVLNFDGYALTGGLATLDLSPTPDCP